jgi:hypothetical protein
MREVEVIQNHQNDETLATLMLLHGRRDVTKALLLPFLRSLNVTRYKMAASAESTISKKVYYQITSRMAPPSLPGTASSQI